MHLLKLPVELLVLIAVNLDWQDHIQWGSTCRTLWELSRRRLNDYKWGDRYMDIWAIGKKNIFKSLLLFLRSPRAAFFVQRLILSTLRDNIRSLPGIDQGILDSESKWKPSSTDDKDYIRERIPTKLDDLFDHENLEPIRLLILLQVPNLRDLDYTPDANDPCLAAFVKNPDILKTQCLQNLTRITLHFSGDENRVLLSSIQPLLNLPELYVLRALSVDSDIQDSNCNSSIKNSSIKVVEFENSNIPPKDFAIFLKQVENLLSFVYQAEEETTEHEPAQELLRILEREHGRTLEELQLSTGYGHRLDAQSASTYMDLQGFHKLSELQCEWGDIIASPDQSLSADMLPLTLEVLRLKRCKRNDIEALKGFMGDNDESKLRRIELFGYEEYDTESQAHKKLSQSENWHFVGLNNSTFRSPWPGATFSKNQSEDADCDLWQDRKKLGKSVQVGSPPSDEARPEEDSSSEDNSNEDNTYEHISDSDDSAR